jgi:hypothetical protein
MFIAEANKRRFEIAISPAEYAPIIPSGIVRHEHDDVSARLGALGGNR